MDIEMVEIGSRIRGLRESCDVSVEEMASELEVPVEVYEKWEANGEDVPISAIYHMARKFGVEFTEILTGTAAKLDTYQVVRAGQGREIDRYPGYGYQDLAWRYSDTIMQPLLVTVEPDNKPAKHMAHGGQEFNYVVEGSMIVEWGDKQFLLNEGDTIYFNASVTHGQRSAGDKPAKFLTVIAE